MTKDNKIARDGFLNYILTAEPDLYNYQNDSIWKKHIATINSQCYFFKSFFEAAEYLKQNNFNGFIYDAYCIKYPHRTEFYVQKVA